MAAVLVTALDLDIDVRLGTLHLLVRERVDAGRTLVVVGPNGAGKTTMLRCIAGLVALDAGRIAIGDEVLDDGRRRVAPERRRVGLVPQEHLLFPRLTVRDNVAFGPRAAGMERPTAAARADSLLASLGLGDLGDEHPGALSGGQAQRVALARALATEPRVLLLDEPLAALDAATRTSTRAELARVLADRGDVVRIVVTHDAGDAAALSDDVLVLEAGRVSQRGPLEHLRARPATAYVEALLAR